MTGDQLSFYDTSKKIFEVPMWPEYQTCFRTCARFTSTDCFPMTRIRRCSRAFTAEMISRLDNNVWHTWCTEYVKR